MWIIHGRKYDLTNYLENHPGGSQILKLAESEEDITPLFESSHAMGNRDKVNHIMSKFEIESDNSSSSQYTFYDDGFYKTLVNRVRLVLPSKNYKSNTWWLLKSIFQIVCFFIFFSLTFYAYWLPFYQRCISSFFSAMFFIQFGFGIMHDASHSAISFNPKINIYGNMSIL